VNRAIRGAELQFHVSLRHAGKEYARWVTSGGTKSCEGIEYSSNLSYKKNTCHRNFIKYERPDERSRGQVAEDPLMFDHRLKHVVAVAQKGSFTRAAEVVCVTQSAITKSVADMERELGYPIFLRTSRGAVPTEDGRDFVERASRLLEDAKDLIGKSRRKTNASTEVLRIGVYPTCLEWRLVEPLTALRERHPGIRLKVNTASQDRVAQQLRNRNIDVALGFEEDFNDLQDFARHPLGMLIPVAFVRREHPLLLKPSISLDDLAQYELVCPSNSLPYSAIINEIYESRGLSSQHSVHIIDYCPLVRRMVSTSDAIGIVGMSSIPRNLGDDFVILDKLTLFEPQTLCLAVRADRQPVSAVRSLINFTCYHKGVGASPMVYSSTVETPVRRTRETISTHQNGVGFTSATSAV
jgi:DNA-binding transcriptional LysR family regulator